MNDAMVSAVEDNSDLTRLMVRARVKGDLERFFKPIGLVPDVFAAAGTDYAYRCNVKRSQFAEACAAAAMSINYGNFKGSVKEDARHDAYMDCWTAMMKLQNHCNPVYGGYGKKRTIGRGVSINRPLGSRAAPKPARFGFRTEGRNDYGLID